MKRITIISNSLFKNVACDYNLRINSIIWRAADDKCYVVMASLDLSMAFDMVNTNLLINPY